MDQNTIDSLKKQMTDIESIAAELDRDYHSAETVKEVEELSDYARKLRDKLNAVSAGPGDTGAFVTINSCVEVYDEKDDELIEYHIVNAHVFELEGNDVTYTSPIGKALLFKQAGDRVEFKIPVGTITYLVKAVKPDAELSIKYELE
jgi:transcription elongation factor GreA